MRHLTGKATLSNAREPIQYKSLTKDGDGSSLLRNRLPIISSRYDTTRCPLSYFFSLWLGEYSLLDPPHLTHSTRNMQAHHSLHHYRRRHNTNRTKSQSQDAGIKYLTLAPPQFCRICTAQPHYPFPAAVIDSRLSFHEPHPAAIRIAPDDIRSTAAGQIPGQTPAAPCVYP